MGEERIEALEQEVGRLAAELERLQTALRDVIADEQRKQAVNARRGAASGCC